MIQTILNLQELPKTNQSSPKIVKLQIARILSEVFVKHRTFRVASPANEAQHSKVSGSNPSLNSKLSQN